MRRVLVTSVTLAIALAPSLAFADDPEPLPPLPPPTAPVPQARTVESTTASADTVHLRDGGLFRGRVIEVVPGDHVTVILATGETKRIVWANVDRVIVASTPIPPPPTKPVVTAPPILKPAPANGPRVWVHIHSPTKVFLYRRPAGAESFTLACESPCDAELPLGDGYQIGGSGISTSAEFHLEAKAGGKVNLSVNGPNWFGIVSGGLLTLAGGTAAYVGTILSLTGATCNNNPYNNCKGMQLGGGIALAAGVAAIALGLVVVTGSSKTDIGQESEVSKDAFVRTPSWQKSTELQAPLSFPIVFQGRF